MKPQDCWYREVCSNSPNMCGASCVRFAEMLNLVQLSNIPEYRWKPQALLPGDDLDSFRQLKEIKDDIKNWVSAGNNLYLYSHSFGNGKTSWAIKLMLAYFNQIWRGNCFRRRGIFISMPEFFDRERQLINNRDDEYGEIRQDLIECDLVIWDDVSAVKMSDYASATFLNFLDARVLLHKSNVFTGNLDENELVEFLGGRLTSRVWNTSKQIQFMSHDRRSETYGE